MEKLETNDDYDFDTTIEEECSEDRAPLLREQAVREARHSRA